MPSLDSKYTMCHHLLCFPDGPLDAREERRPGKTKRPISAGERGLEQAVWNLELLADHRLTARTPVPLSRGGSSNRRRDNNRSGAACERENASTGPVGRGGGPRTAPPA